MRTQREEVDYLIVGAGEIHLDAPGTHPQLEPVGQDALPQEHFGVEMGVGFDAAAVVGRESVAHLDLRYAQTDRGGRLRKVGPIGHQRLVQVGAAGFARAVAPTKQRAGRVAATPAAVAVVRAIAESALLPVAEAAVRHALGRQRLAAAGLRRRGQRQHGCETNAKTDIRCAFHDRLP